MNTKTSDPKEPDAHSTTTWTLEEKDGVIKKSSTTNVQYVVGGSESTTSGENAPLSATEPPKDASPRCVSCNRACHSSLMLKTPRGGLCPVCRPASFALTKTSDEFGLRIGGPGFLFHFKKPNDGFSLTVEVDHALYRTAK